eukprot:PhF_6_TR2311/c1_g1_i1/m.4076
MSESQATTWSEHTPTCKVALVFLLMLGSVYFENHFGYSPTASSLQSMNKTSSPTLLLGLPKITTGNDDHDTKNRKSSSCGDTLIVGPGEWKNTTITTSSSSSSSATTPTLLFHELNCPGTALTDYNNYEQKTKLRECLRGKKLLFIGHSHMRYVVIELGHMLGIYHVVDKRRTTVLRDREYDIAIHYGFSWSKRTAETRLFMGTVYDAVVINIGVWELHYIDDDMRGTVLAMQDYFSWIKQSLVSYSALAKSSVVIILNLWAFHGRQDNPPPRVDPGDYVRLCQSHDRMNAYRRMITCAASRTFPQALHADVYEATIGEIPRVHTIPDGHHYRQGSPMLRKTVQVLMRGICGGVASSPPPTTSCEHLPSFRCHLGCRCNFAFQRDLAMCQAYLKYRGDGPRLSPVECYPRKTELKADRQKSAIAFMKDRKGRQTPALPFGEPFLPSFYRFDGKKIERED